MALAQTKLGLHFNNPYDDNFVKARKTILYDKKIREMFPEEVNYQRKKHRLVTFPYEFNKKYEKNNVVVLKDEECGYPFVEHFGERLYFPIKWNDKKIRSYYQTLMNEQDQDSPHCYFSEMFNPLEKEIFVDVGCAEAFTALSVACRVKKVILFECDPLWKEPLKLSFSKYKDKTIIIEKYVGDKSEGNVVSLDDALKDYYDDPMLVKMDIEGNEQSALKGAKTLLGLANKRFAICTYHNFDDAEKIQKVLKDYNYQTDFSKGYMLNLYSELIFPFFRKGVCRAWKA